MRLNDIAIIIAAVTDVSLIPNKARFVIFHLDVLKTFVSCIFPACRWEVGFSGQTRKAILSDITLNICFAHRRFLSSVLNFSIFQPLFGISSQALN